MKSSEFKLLVMPYSSRLYRMAFRLMSSREEAEDMVQEVYVKLWGMRNDWNRYNSIEALAVRITRNLCLDQLRRRKVNQDAMKAEQLKEESHSVSPAEEPGKEGRHRNDCIP
jgi:RNA polymerase sigma factor (sigma-70 family)